MATLMQSVARVAGPGPKPRRWTREEFYRLLDEGYFLGQRVELVEGEIIEVAAQTNFHAVGIALGEESLLKVFPRRHYWVRVQMSLDLTPFSVVDPDLAVIAGSMRQNATQANPTTALHIMEVSLSTLLYDQRWKGSLYAKVGIADYWILNLEKRHLEVYRKPAADAKAAFGYRYAETTIFNAKDRVAPLAKPQGRIRVADLLP
jgi:Uma2 family endonuclease